MLSEKVMTEKKHRCENQQILFHSRNLKDNFTIYLYIGLEDYQILFVIIIIILNVFVRFCSDYKCNSYEI